NMSIWDSNNYKELVTTILKQRPKSGRGEYRRLAQYLRISPVLITQILKGPRDFTIEQAVLVAQYLGFSPLERDLIVLLVSRERAGTHQLKSYYSEQITLLRTKAQEIRSRIKK